MKKGRAMRLVIAGSIPVDAAAGAQQLSETVGHDARAPCRFSEAVARSQRPFRSASC